MPGHSGEKITEGLDGLPERLAEYRTLGARFAKWRTVISLGAGLPSRACIEANAHSLALYAAYCQEASMVPIVEPEVLMEGEHTMEQCHQVTEELLRAVFNQLYTQGVMLEGLILKPNMVLPGLSCSKLNLKRPWPLAFSFARAIQQPALEIWHGESKNIEAAQSALLHRAQCNQFARAGEYNANTELQNQQSLQDALVSNRLQ